MKKFIICAAAAIGFAAAIPLSASAAEDEALKGWQTNENGRIFYYDENGEMLNGTQTIDGVPYLFADNGALKTGWRTVDGKRRYYDNETGKPVYGWLEYGGNKYFLDPDEGKMIGCAKGDDGSSYLLGEYGYIVSKGGINEVGGNFYYVKNGKLVTEVTEISGIPYNIGEDGIIATGWQDVKGKRYYFDTETAKPVTGKFVYEDSVYYITAANGMLTGDNKINGIWYRFGSDGKFMSGWQVIDGKTHYYNKDMSYVKNLTTINGRKYIFTEDGIMRTGRILYNGKKYYTGSDGVLKTGFIKIDGKYYVFDSDGVMLTGWQTADGKKRYFNADGEMLTGRQVIGGEKYALGDDGVPQTGIVKYSDGDYFFGSDGKMKYGWQTYNGSKYYFESGSGKMLKYKVWEGYWLDENGAAKEFSDVQKKADSVIKQIGTKAINIYNYVATNNKYKYIEATRSLEAIEQKGWSYFASYALSNKFVVCYYFAAVQDLLFQQAGYESRIVYGTGRGSGVHYWNQIKVDGKWTNYDACNGYINVTDAYLASQNYTWDSKRPYIYPNFNK